MENVDKKNIGLPSRYINALYELCDEAKNLKKITQDFEKFIKLVEDNKNLNNLQITKYLINIAKKHISIGKKVKIKFVKDRPGHDLRYALNSNKIKSKLKWNPKTKIFDGLNKTFLWYYNNQKYFKNLKEKDITKRLGS